MNRYPLWKYLLVLLVVILSVIYALPNLYGEDSAVQISGVNGAVITDAVENTVQTTLAAKQLTPKAVRREGAMLLVLFTNQKDQAEAKESLQAALGNAYTVAFNLVSASPGWLRALGANPMKLGLDLRGGIHFLLQVDVESVIAHRVQGDARMAGDLLRAKHIRYLSLSSGSHHELRIVFRNAADLGHALSLLSQQLTDFTWQQENSGFVLTGDLAAPVLQSIRENTVQQAIMTLRRRVNELGISEPQVQQQGVDRISVDLPGVQDAARAQNIIGKTATLEFHLVDVQQDPGLAVVNGAPAGTELLYTQEGHRPVLLESPIILKGSAITSAYSSIGQDGRPQVVVRLGGGGGEERFAETTAANVGRPMGVVYVETKSTVQTVAGKTEISYTKIRDVINVATIQSALGNSFQITGLTDMETASNLALLLRAGSLPTTVTIVEEQTVGPSLGQANIERGVISVVAGLLIIIVFMALYYSVFGLIADIGLIINLFFLVAIMSLLGAVLTLPGIAGMVLTVGMAVDANVLINERIREELRQGLGVAASIQAGYDKALSTIIDSNITTLIAAIVLLSIGSGAVKGFAVTLTIGILTSMFTAITVTRSLVHFLFGRKRLTSFPIGLNWRRLKKQVAERLSAKND